MKLGEKLSSMMEGLSPRQLLMLAGVAGVLAFLIFYFTLSKLTGSGDAPSQPSEPKIKMVRVVQAQVDIKARDKISESMLQKIEVPENIVPEGAISEVSGIVGRAARVAIMAGDFITDKKLYRDNRDSTFAGRIPNNRRAMSVGINDVTGVSGFMKPGDYVDVMLVSEKAESGKIVGELILQDVLLLGVNQATERPEDGVANEEKGTQKNNLNFATQSRTVTTATLAVHPEDELRLAVAAQAGQIYLSLRPHKPSDMYIRDTQYFFFTNQRITSPSPAAHTPAPRQSYSPPASGASDPGSDMEIIRGTKASRGQ